MLDPALTALGAEFQCWRLNCDGTAFKLCFQFQVAALQCGNEYHTSASTIGSLQAGATLVHFSAQRKRFLWDRGCQALFEGYSWGIRGYYGVLRASFCLRNGSG